MFLYLKAEDVDLMVERMEEQMKQLTKAYREELTQIEVGLTVDSDGLKIFNPSVLTKKTGKMSKNVNFSACCFGVIVSSLSNAIF